MPYPPRDGDVSMEELIAWLHPQLVTNNKMQAFIKWTCPSCGERVTSDDPLTLTDDRHRVCVRPAYLHTEKDDGSPCMISVSVYTHKFGCMIIHSNVRF